MHLTLNFATSPDSNQRRSKLILVTVSLILLLVLLGQVRFLRQHQQQVENDTADLAALIRRQHELQPEPPDPSRTAQQRQSYDRAKQLMANDAFQWTLLLDRLEGLLPNGVTLRTLQPNYEKNSLLLTGIALDLSHLQLLLGNLLNTQFTGVFLQNQADIDLSDGSKQPTSALSFTILLTGVY